MYSVVICGSTGRSLRGFKLSVQISIKWSIIGKTDAAHHIQAGYPGIQHSGKAMSCAPLDAASAIREQVLSTVASRSSHTGSACVTATRTCFDVDMLTGRVSILTINLAQVARSEASLDPLNIKCPALRTELISGTSPAPAAPTDNGAG